MSKSSQKTPRRQQILECLAHMLEESPGARITTAALAQKVGVSEAALYRHFPSKTKMFEGLIEFMEEAVFSQISIIISKPSGVKAQCEQILWLLLMFCELNPGITRIMTGDAIIGETDRLRRRIIQFFERLETQLKKILREAELREGLRTQLPATIAANSLLALAEGRIVQYVRSEFKRLPTEHWPAQLDITFSGFFHPQNQAVKTGQSNLQ
ncbi:nucleoid occlusion factor SlmA [Candidatus Endobugula sertula]|uniref:Nucleoid occlusion factor SlmA n=1 Tax=Candidatus Endobugula sertula TaxID=62101 RepID=A0A1D2QRG3_9GAMM|nr:nucleoid occlusion factor SlmA [Candidatus Endobugula sertula]